MLMESDSCLVLVTSGHIYVCMHCRGEYICVFLLTGKVLPGVVVLPKVDGSLQNPKVRTGRVCELNQHVGHVEELQRHREEEIHIKEHVQT